MKRILWSLSLSACLAFGSHTGSAADKAPENKTEKSDKAGPRPRPVMGKIEAVDKTMKTLTLSGEKKQVLVVTSETKIMKAGQPALFADATVGEAIRGSVIDENGKLVLRSLLIGAKPAEAGEKAGPKGPAKAKKKAKEAAEKASGASDN